MEQEKQKKSRVGGQVSIYDPNDKLKESLDEVKEYWEQVNPPAKYSYSSIAEVIITQYAELLKKQSPKRIDTKKLFDLRE